MPLLEELLMRKGTFYEKYRFGVPYERMAYVGDNLRKDFHAPRMLGMPYVYFRDPESLYIKEANALCTVKNLAALKDVFF